MQSYCLSIVYTTITRRDIKYNMYILYNTLKHLKNDSFKLKYGS